MDYLDKIREIKDRYLKINEELMNPEIVSDQTKFVKLSKERRDLSEIVAAYDEYLDVAKNFDESKEILESSSDSELKQFAESELVPL